jgi:hypothetical protein
MPDQHSAATEHELISTIAEPLDQLPEDPLAMASADFPIALRGYDRLAVDAYVERTIQLIAELRSTRSPEAAVRRALERVGEEISGILQRAHDTADEITARSRSEAEARLESARREALELTAEAERRVADLDAETERIWAERHSIVTDVRELASRLTGLAEEASERFPAASAPEPADVSAPMHPFDGAVEVPDLGEPGDDENTTERPPTDGPVLEPWVSVEPEEAVASGAGWEPPVAPEPGLEPPVAADEHTHASSVDQPTAPMPAVEPWEGDEPGPFDPRSQP